ncbi:leucyl aminopeptidase [Desulfolithobacter sp.]
MIQTTSREPRSLSSDILVYFAAETGKKTPDCADPDIRKILRVPWKNGDFNGKEGQVLLIYPSMVAGLHKKNIKAGRILVVGLGKGEKLDSARREQLRLAGGTAARKGSSLKAREMVVVLPDSVDLPSRQVAECLTEGLILGNYRFDKYKSNSDDENGARPVERFILHPGGHGESAVRKGMARGRHAALAACTARDMANEPGNGWTPERFALYGNRLAREYGLRCQVLDKQEMEKLGMGGILAVNQGSATPPRLVILEYRTRKKNPTLMLVGKGLTFDSGGVSLKPASGMEEMKYDMCGGAAVMAAMEAIAQEKPAGINVVALVPATDNMPSGTAIKPGDIITHYNGKTSEIINTDAEGRLILADALAYGVEKFKPDGVVDLATLTGAVIIGLGHHHTGLLANNDQLAGQLQRAGELAGEPLWRLPLGKEYRKQLKSEVADLKNTGGRPAGTITAACYLEEFVGEVPWAHLDIAGTAWNFTEKSYIPKGPSGIGTRTIINLVLHWKNLSRQGGGKD